MNDKILWTIARLYYNCEESIANTGDQELTEILIARRETLAGEYWDLSGNEPDPPKDRRSPPPSPALPPPW